MKDLFFYPICALLVGGMIWYALSFTKDVPPIDISKGYEVSGEDLQYFLVPQQLEFSLQTDEEIGQTVAVLTSSVNIQTAPPSAGINMRLGPEFETAFAGRDIEMTVRARAGDLLPTPQFKIGYFSIDGSTTGWQSFTPTAAYADYKISLKKAPLTGEPRGDHAGIWPDLEGQGRTLNIASITVKAVTPELQQAP